MDGSSAVPTDVCPPQAEIERFAGGDRADERLVAHVAQCATCAHRVQQSREDAAFLQRLRQATGPTAGPEGAPRLLGYAIQGVISTGAQGIVYRGVQRSTQRPVAIKTLILGSENSPKRRMRAEREAEIAARLRHPNIVTVYESVALPDGRVAVVMEYVDGVPLDSWQPPGDTPAARQRALLEAFILVAQGVHHAHLNGVIHRDLKPDNILVTPDGRPVVLDFGIAKAGGISTTMTGEFAGTPAYASPEQASGRPDHVDALTDVYSLGVVLYRVLCGELPYSLEGSLFDIARVISETPPVPPKERKPEIPSDLQAIVLRALEKERSRRYQSAAGLARDIQRFLAGDPVDARSDSGWYVLRKAIGMNRRRVALVGGIGLLLLSAGASVVISAERARDSNRLAELRKEQAKVERIRARAVSELLRDAMPNEDPERPELTGLVGQGLSRLFYRIEAGGYAAEPALDQELRRLWGGVYTNFGSKGAAMVEYSEVSLRHGLVRLRERYGEEHAEIAATMHQLAAVLLFRKRYAEAETICEQALAMRRKLLGADDPATAETIALHARVLYAIGKSADAAREAAIAISVLQRAPGHETDASLASMLALQGRVAFEAGEMTRAEPLLTRALTIRLKSLQPDDADLLASLGAAADFADREPASMLSRAIGAAYATASERSQAVPPADQLRSDLPRLRAPNRGIFKGMRSPPTPDDRRGRTVAIGRLIRLHEQLVPEGDLSLVGLLLEQVRAAEAEGLRDARADSALRAATILARHHGDNDFSVLLCVQEAALAQAFNGQFGTAVELARQATRIWASMDGRTRDPLLAANSKRYLAWFLTLNQQNAEAVSVGEEAKAELAAILGEHHYIVASCRTILAVNHVTRGDLDAADAESRQAYEDSIASPAIPIDQRAHVLYARGMVLDERGRRQWGADVPADRVTQIASTLRDYERAWSECYVNVYTGPEFPWAHDLVKRSIALNELIGDHQAAERWRSRLAENFPPAVRLNATP